MSGFADFERHDALGLADLVRRGKVTPADLLDAAIDRVEARNPLVNAVVIKLYDYGRRAIADGLPDGPLRGVPFLVKDLTASIAGVPMTRGSRFFAGSPPAAARGPTKSRGSPGGRRSSARRSAAPTTSARSRRPTASAGRWPRSTSAGTCCWRRVFAFSPFTVWFNLTGQPAIVLPLGRSGTGLPVAVQLVARAGDEGTLFRLASRLETARPWLDRRPALAA